ncbi:hypothetical protein DBR06_SOUSAS13110047, partial [Sousa chinensis]
GFQIPELEPKYESPPDISHRSQTDAANSLPEVPPPEMFLARFPAERPSSGSANVIKVTAFCPSLVWDGREKQLGVAESSMSYEVNSPFRGRYSPWQNGQVGTTCSFNLSLIFLLLPGAQVVLPLADCLPTQ